MSHELFMRAAIEQARLALAAGEVPIGAVLVMDGAIIGRGFNQPIGATDPTAHAEVQVLRAAARIVGNYRLTGATVYVTVEPCLMCVGALIHARVGEVVFGAAEPKAGALVSAVRALDTPGLNHRFSVTSGVLEDDCRAVIQQFFRDRRSAARAPAPEQLPDKGAGNPEADAATGGNETADNARISGSERWPSG